jgi:hypothetical protein
MYVVCRVTPHSNVIRQWLLEGDFSWVQKGRRESKQRQKEVMLPGKNLMWMM